MKGRGRIAGLLVACLVAAGCGGDAPAPSPSGSSPPAAAPTSPPPSPAAPAEITLAFGGDVHFTGRTAGLLREPAKAFGRAIPLLSNADLALVNLETAVTTRGKPEPKRYHFRAPASTYAALRGAGIDAASLANNHALDYGQIGLLDTLDSAKRASYPVFGAGRDATEAHRPWTTEVRGVRVAVLGFSQIRMLASTWAARDNRPGIAMAWDVERAVAAVTAARRDADLVIVFNHWGQEGNECPTADQKRFAGKLAAAGADIIVGTHAHTLQGDGWLGKTYVAYGLGNFLWYGNSASTQTGVLRLTVRGRQVVRNEFVPAVVSGTGQPVPLTGAAAKRQRDRFADLRTCTGLSGR
jgi:poly-gamma-glutamate capsule biosynthesis protein CapA/YwtB (metallophosphatase superfamily)